MYKRILVAIDGGGPARDGLEIACALADAHRAKLVLLCVTDPDWGEALTHTPYVEGRIEPASYGAFAQRLPIAPANLQPDTQERARYAERFAAELAESLIAEATAFAHDQHVPELVSVVRHGDAIEAIVTVAAEREADLIVLGSAGRTGLRRLLHPSVASGVRRQADRPVLVLYPGGHD